MRTNALAARATAESETAVKVDAVRMLTLVVSLAALVLGTLTPFFIGRGISRPVITMTKAMGALAGGDKTVEIMAKDRRDELGNMANTVQVFKVNAIDMMRPETEQQAKKQRATAESNKPQKQKAAPYKT